MARNAGFIRHNEAVARFIENNLICPLPTRLDIGCYQNTTYLKQQPRQMAGLSHYKQLMIKRH
jgi:hypothetical protein